MRDAIAHEDFHIKERPFSAPHWSAARVHTGIIQTTPQPGGSSGVYVWLDGEFYNQSDLRNKFGIPQEASDDASLLSLLYASDPELSFLSQIDGIYSAVIIDTSRRLLHLLIDRYGLRHLYYSHNSSTFAWASEVKAFLQIPGFRVKIDDESVRDFFAIGYLLNDRTWFSNATLLSAGSVLTLELDSMKSRISTYWNWDAIKPLPTNIDQEETVAELGRLFTQSVRRQSQSEHPVGVSLSGGLDSRALLAAIPNNLTPVHVVTFGRYGCDDIRIAAEVAHARPAIHHVVELTSENWIRRRLRGVWYTDGQNDLFHMHALVSADEQRKHYRVNLNGFLGDAVLGASYLGDKRWSIPEKTHQRGRRFINEGTRLMNNFFHNRIPFFSNALMEFTCSIPETMRANSRIYNKMLLEQFPALFRTIPWKTTGLPITYRWWAASAIGKYRAVKRRATHLLSPSPSGSFSFSREYNDYARWIRENPARSLFESALLSQAAMHREFVPIDARQLLKEHLARKDHSEMLCRLFTFEVWLQQVFEGRFREESPEVENSIPSLLVN